MPAGVSGCWVSPAQVAAVIRQESAELARREKIYRCDRSFPDIAGRTVMVVDDGMATRATMSAAVELLRQQKAGRIVVAVPVAMPDTVERLRREADEVVTVTSPDPFSSVGQRTRISPKQATTRFANSLETAGPDNTIRNQFLAD